MSNNKQSSVEKEFVPYAEALALKELGFDEPCFAYWNADPSLTKPFLNLVKPFDHEWCISTPLYQQAFRWFREKNLSDACVCRYQGRDDGGIYFYYVINHDYGIEETRHFKEGFCSYEEAELACLKKLIEIVKEKNNEQQ